MFATLLACACPTFEEMEVVAVDDSATEHVTDEVRLALAHFAEWTGDAGVCVPELRVQEDIAEPLAWRGRYTIGGQYRGKNAAILIDADSDAEVGQRAFHELCHATDRMEGHHGAVVWPEAEGGLPLDGDRATREDFAQACQGGPPDVALDAAIVELCDENPAFGDGDYYLAEVVFPESPQTNMVADVTPATVTRRVWAGVSDEDSIEDVMAIGDRIGILLIEPDGSPGKERLVLQVWDAELETLEEEVVVASDADAVGAAFVRADTGVNLYSYVRSDRGHASSAFVELDLDGGSPLQHAVGDVVSTDVVSSGVAYGFREGGFVATPIGGDSETLAYPWALFGWDLEPWTLWPEEDGFGFYADVGLGRYDAGADAWTLEPAPDGLDARVDLGDGRSIVRAASRMLLYADGAYTFAGDPCPGWDVDWADDLVVGLGDRIVAFAAGTASGGVRTVTEVELESE